MNVVISEKRVLMLLAAAALYLCVQSFAAKVYEFSLPVNGSTPFIYYTVLYVNVTFEQNLPSWYSTLLLATTAALIALIAKAHHVKQDRFRWRWTGLSVIFFYLSLDEMTALHERFTEPLRTALNTENFLYFAWSIVGVIFVLIVAVLYWRLVWALPKRTRSLVFLAAFVYLGGALIIDAISAFWFRDDAFTLIYHAIATVEEFCEMMGISLFVYALLEYLRNYAGQIRFTFVPNQVAIEQSVEQGG